MHSLFPRVFSLRLVPLIALLLLHGRISATGAELWPLRKQTWRLSQDPAENARLVRAAAERGDATYQYHYAKMLSEGRCVSEDGPAARAWFLAAAKQGNLNAQCRIGVIMDLGIYGPKNGPEGLAWLEKAAAQGHGRAISAAASVNYLGNSVPRNPAKALYWNLKSVERGRLKDAYFIALQYRSGEGVAKDLEAARQWMRKAAATGDPPSRFEYAKMLIQKPGATTADLTEAAAWLELSLREYKNHSAEFHTLLTQVAGISRTAIEERAAQLIKELPRVPTRPSTIPTQPKAWQKVHVDNACAFHIPPTLEIHAPGSKEVTNSTQDREIEVPDFDSSVVVLPKDGGGGLRIELRTDIGAGEEYPASFDNLIFTPAELGQLAAALRQEVAAAGSKAGTEPHEILSTEPAQVIALGNGRQALRLACRRRIGDGKVELVQQFRIPYYDRMHILTLTINEDAPPARHAELQQILMTFRFHT